MTNKAILWILLTNTKTVLVPQMTMMLRRNGIIRLMIEEEFGKRDGMHIMNPVDTSKTKELRIQGVIELNGWWPDSKKPGRG